MLKRNSLCVRPERKQYSPSIPVISHLAASLASPRVRFRSSRRIMNRPLSLQCCRNACQHRLVGHFLSRGHRSIDVTHNAAEAETERGFFSCLCPAAFSTHKHTYEAIEPPCFLPRASPSFLCPLDRPAQYRERDEETEKRKRETADLVSFIFHGAPLCQTHSLEYRFLRVFVSEARNSACPSQLRGRDTRFAAKAASGIVGARGVIPQPLAIVLRNRAYIWVCVRGVRCIHVVRISKCRSPIGSAFWSVHSRIQSVDVRSSAA